VQNPAQRADTFPAGRFLAVAIVTALNSRILLRPALLVVAAVLAALWAVLGLHVILAHEAIWLGLLSLFGIVITWGLVLAVRRYQARLESLATTDPLTGLANHRGFYEALDTSLAQADRAGEPVSVVLIDLDNFKMINDTHGHPYGDKVLIACAERLRGSTRGNDLVARIGGEEFALILRGTGGDQASEIAGRVRAAIARVPTLDAELTCSAGIAVYPDDGADAATLCQLADGAMYSAKRAGKDRVRRFDPEHVPFEWSERQTAEVEAVLGSADAIHAVYQPVVSLATGRLVGYEAFARFPGLPGRPVASLFAQAQGCGLGPELQAQAIRVALGPLGRPPGTHLAVNVAPSALSSPVVQAALPTDLTDLVIELTEHEIFADDERLAASVRRLRDRGARIAIDDTGAGYAGLKQLMRIKPDVVKIDRDLTRAIHTDPARMALVESLVRFAGRIGAVVCAEGIESLDDLSALADLDVEWGQGFAVGRPATPWPPISPTAAAAARNALAEAMRAQSGFQPAQIVAGDRRLERLSARLAGARSRKDLEDSLGLIAAELGADRITLSQWHRGVGTIDTLAESHAPVGEPVFPAADYPLTEHVLRTQEATQVLVGDPDAEPTEVELMLQLGYRSLLMVPVVRHGESLGLVEAYTIEERAWARTEINRARIVANQLAAVIEVVSVDRERA
jgi:diguanylate cyclase (GGDEF)-like protein